MKPRPSAPSILSRRCVPARRAPGLLFSTRSTSAMSLSMIDQRARLRARREVLGQRPPLAAGRQHVEDRVHDLAHVGLPPAAARARRQDERRDQRPFRVGQIARLTPATRGVTGTLLFGPHRAPSSSNKVRRHRITTDSSDSTTFWSGSKCVSGLDQFFDHLLLSVYLDDQLVHSLFLFSARQFGFGRSCCPNGIRIASTFCNHRVLTAPSVTLPLAAFPLPPTPQPPSRS